MAVHIRRGDFLLKLHRFRQLSDDYYLSCMCQVYYAAGKAGFTEVQFDIFSNSPPKSSFRGKNNIKWDPNAIKEGQYLSELGEPSDL